MLEKLTSKDFTPYLNHTFRIHLSDEEHMDVRLTEITELGTVPPDETARHPFSLIFRGPSDSVLPQRIYRLEHDEMGHMDIFLVPVGPDQEGMQYEAMFT